METLGIILSAIIISAVLYLIFEQRKNAKLVEKISEENKQFLESIEKYVEIFNEQNVKDILANDDLANEKKAASTISLIKKEYKLKLELQTGKVTEEQEILVDFIGLCLSMLIKTPPRLRLKLINENTTNEDIKKILKSKLKEIEKHYIPVSILEVALSERS
ncbi:MAG: hypothetical protein KDC90_02700 [Ignavibacteriae bacterium]|nr:hypothetical protein [Ignavibacteriota bacterium]